jgi:hypothetical protein
MFSSRTFSASFGIRSYIVRTIPAMCGVRLYIVRTIPAMCGVRLYIVQMIPAMCGIHSYIVRMIPAMFDVRLYIVRMIPAMCGTRLYIVRMIPEMQISIQAKIAVKYMNSRFIPKLFPVFFHESMRDKTFHKNNLIFTVKIFVQIILQSYNFFYCP